MASYVEHGAADVGVAGLDVLREEPRDLYEPLDLGIGRCRVIVGRPRGPLPRGVAPRVATKETAAARHFARKGIPRRDYPAAMVDFRRWGLADQHPPWTSPRTGETLRANGLAHR